MKSWIKSYLEVLAALLLLLVVVFVSHLFNITKVTERILCWSLSGLMVYAAFLEKAKEDIVRAKIRAIMSEMKEAQSGPVSREIMFLRSLAVIATRVLDRIFGNKLFSWKFILTSSYYSTASACLFLSLYLYFAFHANFNVHRILFWGSLFFILICILLGSLPALRVKHSIAIMAVPAIILGLLSVIDVWYELRIGGQERYYSLTGLGLFVFAGLLSIFFDALLIIIVRTTIRSVIPVASLKGAILRGLFLSGLGILLLVGPLAAGGAINNSAASIVRAITYFQYLLAFFLVALSTILVFAGLGNMTAAFAALFFPVLSLLMLIAFILIPPINRFLCTADRFDWIGKHKVGFLVAAGCFLFVPVYGPLEVLWKLIFK